MFCLREGDDTGQQRSTAEVILLAVVTRDSTVSPGTAEFYSYTDLISN